MNIELIAAPLIGGMIGLITNSLAIKMLFRPYQEIKIWGIHIPFTPGLIPKEKPRIAHAIAQVISNYILDDHTIFYALTSDNIKKTYEKKYQQKRSEWLALDITCEELLEKYHLEHDAHITETELREILANYFVKQCQKEDVARKLLDQAFFHLKDHMNPLLYKVGKNALNAAKKDMIEQANVFLAEKGNEFVGNYIDQIYIQLLDLKVCELVSFIEQKIPNLEQLLWEKYIFFMEHHFFQFLQALDISGIIEDRINAYDFEELEKMILEISRKELSALVWLGGLLGTIMGFFNLLF